MATKKQAALGFIFITLLIDVTGFGIIIPVIPTLLQNLTGCSISKAAIYGGWLQATYAIMQFFIAPVLGNLSDKYGRRPILLFALFGFAADYLFTAFAPTIFWLFIGRIIAGITGASFSTASAYIGDISTPEKKAQNFGMIGVAFGIGFIIGPLLGGILGKYDIRFPFFAAAFLAMLNFLYGFVILPESLPKEKRRAFNWNRANPIGTLLHFKKYPVILGLVVSIFLLYVASHAVQTTWGYYSIHKFGWNAAEIGWSLAFVGLVIAIVQGGLIRIIIPKIGQEKSVYIGLAFYALGFFLFGIASQSWMMYAFMIVYGLGGLTMPALQGIMSNEVPTNEQGELQGGLTSLMSLALIIGPILMTNVFAYFSSQKAVFYIPGAAMYLGCILTVVSSFLAYNTLVTKKKKIKI
jgi:DHA1 family tetracycline resistance protein-like MFS transporter